MRMIFNFLFLIVMLFYALSSKVEAGDYGKILLMQTVLLSFIVGKFITLQSDLNDLIKKNFETEKGE